MQDVEGRQGTSRVVGGRRVGGGACGGEGGRVPRPGEPGEAEEWIERIDEQRQRSAAQAWREHARAGPELAYVQWRHLALLSRWRLRAMLRQVQS